MIVRTHHYEYTVNFMDRRGPDWKPGGDQPAEDVTGYVDFDHEVINIADDITPAMAADTLLHEMLHVSSHAGGIAENVKMTEEQVVCAVTAGLKQLLTLDNDEVFEYLGVNL